MDYQQSGRKQAANSPEVAIANEVFDQFCNATTLKSILGHYRQLCELLKIRPNTINQFYPKLKAKLRSWKTQALWKKFDQRANHKCYNRGKASPNTRVLIIGGGPCGLRSAIEAQLLGAKVVVIEKRDRMSRNNVLHLWPFVIQDLRSLGAKKFFGKFCAGSIDHISIRQLQCILLKVALILGVEFHESVSFDSLIPPPENQEEGKIGWRAKTTPADHPVSQYEFDVLIGADGKRNTLEGFKRKEFRGKLAIAITANFINKRTEAEARVEEISGVAFIFNQKFFKELYQETGIDLENIVYYKDDTHYFVMTAKKHSLIDKGVILQDHPDTAKLLAKENVDREALMLYAREAAEFSTEYQMMDMEFAVNHYGQPDVAMFDFTSMYAAENASRILERHGHRLLMILVGDSLLEPFWPTGSGCARGFLSSLDACWAIKGWGASMSPLEVIAERESIYRLLGQTTPENLNRDYAAYTLDPHTRYPNLNISSVTPMQVRSLLDTDDPDSIKQPPVQSEVDIPKKRRRRDLRGDSQVHPDALLRWLQKQVALYDTVKIEDMGASFKDGLAICAIIHRYRPDLIDFHSLQPDDLIKNNQLAFDILEKELGISPIMTGEEMAQCDVPDKLAMFSYLTQIYEVFRGEIPHIKHPKLEPENEERPAHKQLNQLTPDQKAQLIDRIARQDSATRTRHSRSRHNENLHPLDKKGDTISRRSRKRRSTEKMGATVEERQKRLAEIEKNRAERMRRRQYLRHMATQQFYKSMQMLQANAKREKDEPFEDYSIFLYRQTAPDFKDRVKYLEQKILYPDREPKIHAGHRRSSIDEEFSGRIKNIEDKLRGSAPFEKKPKDLLRAIGKIEKTDWNVKEIEKKIEESKMGRSVRHDKVERVPKWSREQFLARQIKMEKKGRDQKESDSKYADIDNTLKNIDRKIKEGNVLGYNKVSAMAEQFSNKNQDAEPKVQKSNTKATVMLPTQGGSEMCHFCNKRVYLMEKLSAEGKFFHRGCFRCEYCSTSLRIGNHTFDREKNGGRFYCTQHFGFPGTIEGRAEKKRITVLNKENIPNAQVNMKTPEKTKVPLEGVVGLDLLDRGQTPERIEFENLAGISDAEDAQSQMDEDEWTDRNFGASTAEMGSSDDISDMSDSDDDNEVYEEAIDQPLTTEGTLELAKNWTLRYSHPHAAAGQSDTGSNEYEDSSDEYTSEDDESETATEDEEDIRARELRKQEVWVKHPTRSSDTDTGSETEVKISEDSVHKVTQEPYALPESVSPENSSLPFSQVENVNNNEIDVTENISAIEDIKDLLNFDSIQSDVSVVNTDHQMNDIRPVIEKDASPTTACGGIIQVPNTALDLIAHNVDRNKANIDSPLASHDSLTAQNLLGTNSNKEDYNSEYENVVDKCIAFNTDKMSEISLKSVAEDNCDKSIAIANNENNVVNDDLNNELAFNSDFKTSNAENILNSNLPAEFAGIMLPDAIPCSEINRDSTALSITEKIVNIDEKLPDLIASPKHSRQSSFSSSSDMYKSSETLYNELLAIDRSHKMETENLNVYELKDTKTHGQDQPFRPNNEHISTKQENELKLLLKDTEEIPILTVTSPSPTSEKPSEKVSIEITKLTVPKEVLNQPVQTNTNSSFDKLKRDLRQRKAKNKVSMGELRPLSTENAQRKISKYFIENKKPPATEKTTVSVQDEKMDEVRVIELDIKPKLSDKVDAKDIMKYFNKAKLTVPDKPEINETNENPNEVDNVNVDIDNLNQIDESDIDIINQQFHELEEQNEIKTLISNDGEQSKLDTNVMVGIFNIESKSKEDSAENADKIEERKQSPEMPFNEVPVSAENIDKIEERKQSPEILFNEIPVSAENIDKIEERKQSPEIPFNEIPVSAENIDKIEERKQSPEVPFNEVPVSAENVTQEDVLLSHCTLKNKLHEEETNDTTLLLKTDVHNKQDLPTIMPEFNGIKITDTKKNNILHSSDSTLNVKKATPASSNVSRKNSKSSVELASPSPGLVCVAKVKIVEQNIEKPLHVDTITINDSRVSLDPSSEPPKRPDRKHGLHESDSLSKHNSVNMHNVPQIPSRKKSAKRKSTIESFPEVLSSQSNSCSANDRLGKSESRSDTHVEYKNFENSPLKSSNETVRNMTSLGKVPIDGKSQSANRQSPIKTDQYEPSKSVPSKSDRSKKDKCVVS